MGAAPPVRGGPLADCRKNYLTSSRNPRASGPNCRASPLRAPPQTPPAPRPLHRQHVVFQSRKSGCGRRRPERRPWRKEWRAIPQFQPVRESAAPTASRSSSSAIGQLSRGATRPRPRSKKRSRRGEGGGEKEELAGAGKGEARTIRGAAIPIRLPRPTGVVARRREAQSHFQPATAQFPSAASSGRRPSRSSSLAVRLCRGSLSHLGR